MEATPCCAGYFPSQWRGVLSARQVSFVLFSQFLLKWLSLTAARYLHNSMLKQLLRCNCETCPRHADVLFQLHV